VVEDIKMSAKIEQIAEVIEKVVIEILKLVQSQNEINIRKLREGATSSVANFRGITYNSVLDKMTVKLYPDIKNGIGEFDKLLEDRLCRNYEFRDLKSILLEHAVSQHDIDIIKSVFGFAKGMLDFDINSGKFLIIGKFFITGDGYAFEYSSASDQDDKNVASETVGEGEFKQIKGSLKEDGLPLGNEKREHLVKTIMQGDELPGNVIAEEINDSEKYPEGAKHQIIVNAYERNAEARRKCIESYGTKCVICGFDFKAKYGEIGAYFINVHHIKPLSEIGDGYLINPIEDLIPVCPNCHAIMHRKKPSYTIEEIKQFITQADLINLSKLNEKI
jgi:hypothetical protein